MLVTNPTTIIPNQYHSTLSLKLQQCLVIRTVNKGLPEPGLLLFLVADGCYTLCRTCCAKPGQNGKLVFENGTAVKRVLRLCIGRL